MENFLLITSTKNERIKSIQKLEKSSERKERGLFLIEGKREIQKAIRSGIQIAEAYYCSHVIHFQEVEALLGPKPSLTAVSSHVFESIAYRENKDGVIAVAYVKSTHLEEIPLPDNPLLIVVEAVEKPGNLGAILRTADAAGVNGVIVCDPKTDIYNPNVVRSSLGCVFTTPIACCSNQQAAAFLKKNNITSLATTPYAYEFYFSQNLKEGIAVVMGSEADGLSAFWLDNADIQVKVPMLGEADSLNVSVCMAVVVYEAVRQRVGQ